MGPCSSWTSRAPPLADFQEEAVRTGEKRGGGGIFDSVAVAGQFAVGKDDVGKRARFRVLGQVRKLADEDVSLAPHAMPPCYCSVDGAADAGNATFQCRPRACPPRLAT